MHPVCRGYLEEKPYILISYVYVENRSRKDGNQGVRQSKGDEG
jgi:hypothetical protein